MNVERCLDLLFPRSCMGCGIRAPALCPECEAGARRAVAAPPPPGVASWSAPFAYEGAVRELVARAKYRGERHVLRWFASCAVRHRSSGSPGPVQAVTWVPTSPQRRRARGFDHAEILARHVARELRLPIVGCLVRLDSATQTNRALHERRSGPLLASRAGTRPCGPILVIDDVATTGASLAAAARVLRAAGVVGVEALTIARTPPPGMRL